MERVRSWGRFWAPVLAVTVCWMTLGLGTAQGGMVATEQVVTEGSVAADRAQVAGFLSRGDVQEQLRALGVSPTEAAERVASLSDGEVQRIAAELDERAAGGDAVSSAISAAVFIFIVLLITDLLGLTNAFNFT